MEVSKAGGVKIQYATRRGKTFVEVKGYHAVCAKLFEIIKANFYVFMLSVHPRMKEKIDPHIFRFKTELKTDFAKFVFANSITLTPGTVTIEIEDDEFIVHAITKQAADDLPGEMEQRIKRAFEPGVPTS